MKINRPFIAGIILIPLVIVLILGCAQSDDKYVESKTESIQPQEVNEQASPTDEPEELPDAPIEGQPQNSEESVAINNTPLESVKRITLKMNEENIILVKKALNKAGFHPNKFDGVLDDQLKEAIINFQNYTGLNPDGIVDLEMIKYLDIYSGGCESAYALKINISK
ncbi:MAG: peptidoglycan-binding domain-containing protein [Tepidibacillus sp.]